MGCSIPVLINNRWGRPRAVLLDFDGVVADSLAAHLSAWDQACQALFRRPLDRPESVAKYATPTIANILATRFGDPSQASDLARVKTKLMVDAVVPVPLFQGAAAFILAMQARGVPTGIASNAAAPFIRAVLAQHGLAVAVVVGRADTPRAKPHPDVFLECARRLGVVSDERAGVLAFDDAPHGIKAAVAAGVQAIGVTTGHTSQELLDAGAQATCADLAEALGRFAWEPGESG